MLRHFVHLWIAVVFALSACSAPQTTLVPYDGAVERVRPVFVATSRQAETGQVPAFGGERSEKNLFAQYLISVPPDREPGSVPVPKGAPNPDTDFLSVGHDRLADRAAFIAGVNRELAKLPPAQRQITVYVHGYNNTFPKALLRAAQLAEDYRLPQPMVLYSWPSAGRKTHYVYDRDSALFARDRFVDTLSALAETRANSIQILAHSMGTFLTMETLRTLQQTRNARVLNKISLVVLAEPDIDVDVFRSQIEAFDLRRMAMVVFGSHNDKALRLSQVIAGGHPRVGEAQNIEELRRLGVIVVDVSDVKERAWAQHSAFESAPELVELIGSGELAREISHAGPGQDVFLSGLHAVGNAALAVAHLPYAMAQ